MKQSFTVRQRALDDVDTFLSIGQHRNFRKAAAELGVTPSAISQAVRALESRVVGSPDYLARHGRPERWTNCANTPACASRLRRIGYALVLR